MTPEKLGEIIFPLIILIGFSILMIRHIKKYNESQKPLH